MAIQRPIPSRRSTCATAHLLAVDAVNSPKEFMLGKRLIVQRAAPSAEQLADRGTEIDGAVEALNRAGQTCAKYSRKYSANDWCESASRRACCSRDSRATSSSHAPFSAGCPSSEK